MNLLSQLQKSFPLLLGLLAIPLLLLIGYSQIKLILLPFLMSCFFIYLIVDNKFEAISFRSIDISWFIFICLALLSIFWSTDMSLVWSPLMVTISLVLFMFCIRWADIVSQAKFQSRFSYLLTVIFVYYLMQHILAVNFDITIEKWNTVLSKNPNYTTSYLLVLYPFFLFYPFRNQFIRFLKFIAAILLLNLLLLTNARGGLLGFIVLLIFYFRVNTNYPYKKRLTFIALLILGFAVVAVNVFIDSYDSQFLLFYKNEILSRWHLIKTSIAIWLDNPILGVGFGNWHIEAYAYNVDNIAPLNNPNEITRFRSYNLYTQLLSELGLVGLVSYCLPFVAVIYAGLKKIDNLKYFEKTNIAVIIFFLIGSYFYSNVNFFEHHFSTIHLLAFFALAVLGKPFRSDNFPKFLLIPLLTFSLVCTLFMVKSKLDARQFVIAKSFHQLDPEKSIDVYKNLYHPHLCSSYDFTVSYSHNLALMYMDMGDTENASIMFDAALSENPNNYNALLDYTDFLLHEKDDIQKSKQFALRAKNIQSNSCRLYLLRSQIAIKESRYDDANTFFGKTKESNCSITFIKEINKLQQELNRN